MIIPFINHGNLEDPKLSFVINTKKININFV